MPLFPVAAGAGKLASIGAHRAGGGNWRMPKRKERIRGGYAKNDLLSSTPPLKAVPGQI